MLRYVLDDGIELRRFMPYDAPALACTVRGNVEHINQFLGFAHEDYSEEEARLFIDRGWHKVFDNSGDTFGIFAGGEVIGSIGFNEWNLRTKSGSIGYWLANSWQGRGIMTNAVRLLTDYALGTLGLNRLEIIMATGNEKSAGIPRRVGYNLEGVRKEYLRIDGNFQDVLVYVMLAEDWWGVEDSVPTAHHEFLTLPLGDDAQLELLMYHHASAYSAEVRKSYNYLAPWLPWVDAEYSDEQAREFTRRFLKRSSENNGMALAMMYQGSFAGWINYHSWDWMHGRTELGYWVGEQFQGKGLVTRAVEALTDYAITKLGLNRVEILTDVKNDPSSRVADRLGYYHEAVRRQYLVNNDGPIDINVYVMLANQWQNRTK